MLEEAEMSQVVNGVTSSSKRPYRKGNPVSAAERQQKAVAR
ncbi:TPA: transcriptional regulator, partial [Klebsiella pneumoniae]|nr:transcriptional regulator [Klebsiella pneumoniae]HCF8937452.1 transcriptional regulator [Klebsiella pneumoniae]HCF8942868.1 transcriptional regulator [Klebsiella pneumoniae]HCF9064796.1 transcriptional regulator [Klebsiella pneumoniae]